MLTTSSHTSVVAQTGTADDTVGQVFGKGSTRVAESRPADRLESMAREFGEGWGVIQCLSPSLGLSAKMRINTLLPYSLPTHRPLPLLLNRASTPGLKLGQTEPNEAGCVGER